MYNIVVHHPQLPKLNNGTSVFKGRKVKHRIDTCGNLTVSNLDGDFTMGTTTFAVGWWALCAMDEIESDEINGNHT